MFKLNFSGHNKFERNKKISGALPANTPCGYGPDDTHTAQEPRIRYSDVMQWWDCISLMSFACNDRLQNLRAGCSKAGLYYVTMIWQQAFKGSLQATDIQQ